MLSFFDVRVQEIYTELFNNLDAVLNQKGIQNKERLIDQIILMFPQEESVLLSVPGWGPSYHSAFGQTVMQVLRTCRRQYVGFCNFPIHPYTAIEINILKGILRKSILTEKGVTYYVNNARGNTEAKNLADSINDTLEQYSSILLDKKLIINFLMDNDIIHTVKDGNQSHYDTLNTQYVLNSEVSGVNRLICLEPCLDLVRKEFAGYLKRLYESSPFLRQCHLTNMNDFECGILEQHREITETIMNGEVMKCYNWNIYGRDYSSLPNRLGYSYVYNIKYIYEYEKAFRTLFAEDAGLLLHQDISVISAGCGSKQDYAGLRLALGNENKEDVRVRYFGYDLQNWDQDVEQQTNMKTIMCPFTLSDSCISVIRTGEEGNFLSYIHNLRENGIKINPDIIIFPTSFTDIVHHNGNTQENCKQLIEYQLWDDLINVLSGPVWVCITFTKSDTGDKLWAYDSEDIKKLLMDHIEDRFSSHDEKCMSYRSGFHSDFDDVLEVYIESQKDIMKSNIMEFTATDNKAHYMAGIHSSGNIDWKSYFIKLNPEGV